MSAVAALRSYTLRRRLGGAGAVPALAVALVPAAIAAIAAWHGVEHPLRDYGRFVAPLCLSLVLPFVAMFTTLPILGELHEKGAIGYLYTRPCARWRPLLGIYQGAVLASLPALLVAAGLPAVILALAGDGESGAAAWLGKAGGVAGALAAGAVVDVAICLLLGVWSRKAVLWALLVLILWGSVVGNLPGSLRDASPHRYLAALLRVWGGIGPQVDVLVLPSDPSPPPTPLALAALAGTTALCLLLSWRAALRRDIL